MDRFEIEEPKSWLARISFRQWIIDVISWDGILPACIFGISFLVSIFVAQNQFPAELLMVALPIIGVLVRFSIGYRKILNNHCTRWLRALQLIALGIAVLMFMAFDFFVVLGAFMKLQHALGPMDWFVLGGIGTIYLSLVTFTMFPGIAPSNVDDEYSTHEAI